MNPFLIVMAVLSLAASCYELFRGNSGLSLVYLSWSVSNAAMSFMGAR
jgi:hypothetical protein